MAINMGVRMVMRKRWLVTHARVPPATTIGNGKIALEETLNTPPKNIGMKDEISSTYNTPLTELRYSAVLPRS